MSDDDTSLGTLYELFLGEHQHNNVHIVRPFGLRTLRRDWRVFSAECVGTTSYSHDEIKAEGIRKSD